MTLKKIAAIGAILFLFLGCTPLDQESDPNPEKGNVSEARDCISDSDCVPAECCHPANCVPQGNAPSCAGVFCTMECKPGTLDCGQGSCLCQDGRCTAEIE